VPEVPTARRWWPRRRAVDAGFAHHGEGGVDAVAAIAVGQRLDGGEGAELPECGFQGFHAAASIRLMEVPSGPP